MKCPVCNDTDLTMTDRQGIEIDYCPKCRGIWLDRGELDKIIERSSLQSAPPARPYTPEPQSRPHVYGSGSRDNEYYKKKKKSSLLSEIFDF